MLVTFSCKAHENITMFGDVAQTLIKMMGHSGTIPSALRAEEVPGALERLRQNVEKAKHTSPLKDNEKKWDEQEEPDVSLKHRAIPLISLLEAASHAKCNVMWKEY